MQHANPEGHGQTRVGLALAGGGPLGLIYEIGAVKALEESLEGVDFNQLHVYVGVSVGSVIASALANGFTPAKLCRIFVRNESRAYPLDPEHFLKPAFSQYLKGLGTFPRLLVEALLGFVRNPHDRSVVAAMSKLSRAIPAGLLGNENIGLFLQSLFNSRGRTDDFRRLKSKLFVIATNLDTGEAVKFGYRGSDHVPISLAVQASTAMPGLFPPVDIEGRYYVDGGLRRTLHASTALASGADLLFCVNPIVPFNADLADSRSKRYQRLVDGGLPVVLSQTFYAIVHSRMKIGMSKYATQYPNKDVILFEPNSGDAEMFFSNVFSFANRRQVCEHAYQTTRRDLLSRKDELAPLFARHGIKLRVDVLEDDSLHFDSKMPISPETDRLAMLQNRVTNSLSDTLDQLQEWLQYRQVS
ncbi:MAG: patatin-like phospholipase family protein [Gammaproteobacteria bacterium]|nr:patatin-like phospholipase family protein [Gammaproteobacteria bacterium]MCP5423727.1 patatin-like phospholipase family protein [Gammaproteobacteria bacterium]MCP5459691.1 patatin-like phospholipase family protein [Gammaproteobacteria bacterium]